VKTNCRPTQFTICYQGKPIGDVTSTVITLVDEDGANWIEISQSFEDDGNVIKIDPEDWDLVDAHVRKLFKEQKNNRTKENKDA
jgi:hypothetical protein